LLAVDSLNLGHYSGRVGPDIAFIDRALAQSFSHGQTVAIAGFSDGASYALSVGITNGDLFTHVIAFSGFMAPARQVRKAAPVHFSWQVGHGATDCSMQSSNSTTARGGYDVQYREFNGLIRFQA